MRVQVKSGAYLQAWSHKEFSQIRFGIEPRRAWDYHTNEMEAEPRRHANTAGVHGFSRHDQPVYADRHPGYRFSGLPLLAA